MQVEPAETLTADKPTEFVVRDTDPETGIDKSVLSTPHSPESLKALKSLKDSGSEVKELFQKEAATDSELDDSLTSYMESMAIYLDTHADNEFSNPSDKMNKAYGEDLRERSAHMLRMSETLSKGEVNADIIQFVYQIKASMTAENKDTSRLQSYVDHKKTQLHN